MDAAKPACTLDGIDHVHVFVADREAAQAWYARVLGFSVVEALRAWAAGGGPLTIADAHETVHLALFEQPAAPNRTTIALRTDGAGLLAWQSHLREALAQPLEFVDHGMSWSLYFRDPWGNPFEITTYDTEAVVGALAQRGQRP
jgi:catechol-2,3-dioxygenase